MTTTETRPDLAELDPVFAQMTEATAAYVRAIPELTDREKTFLSVTADVCQASLGCAFEAHVRAGLAAGVSTGDIRELLRFVSYDCGYHAAAAGVERIAELETDLGLPRPDAEPLAPELVSTGPDAAPSPLPPAVRARAAELDPHFAGFFDLQSRMRTGHGPGTLSERERGLVSLSVDVHYQTLADTFRTHVGRALRGGASPEDVRAALRFNAQFGVTRAWHAWEAVNEILAQPSTSSASRPR
ncbi:carboxymuconolactone decarboxylase family protein [Amycolatopsis sp. NPDC004169]|uniref:carboxymuconolactone decarboxylase family protein n=1 Tax=Amycolatopsis sp. NPDC004169 TaxID=3154453 RepID=UPI0033AD8DE7